MAKMINYQHTAKLGKAAKWLLKITLLFSLSVFFGYAYGTLEVPIVPAKTELVVTDRPVVKRHISYRHGLSKTFSKSLIAGFYQLETSKTSLIREQLFKIAFDAGSKKFFSFKEFPGFQLQKTIPKGSDEDLPYLFVG